MAHLPLGGSSEKAVAGRTAYMILYNTSEIVTPDLDGRTILLSPELSIETQVEIGRAHV